MTAPIARVVIETPVGKAIKKSWNAITKVASSGDIAARWSWQKAGAVGAAAEGYYHAIPAETKAKLGRVASTAAYLGTRAISGSALAPVLPTPIYAGMAVATGVGRGVGKWREGHSIRESIGEGVAATSAFLLGPVLGPAVAAAVPSATFTQAAVASGVGVGVYRHAQGDSVADAAKQGAAVTAACLLPPVASTVLPSAAQSVIAGATPFAAGIGAGVWRRLQGDSVAESIAQGAAVAAAANLVNPIADAILTPPLINPSCPAAAKAAEEMTRACSIDAFAGGIMSKISAGYGCISSANAGVTAAESCSMASTLPQAILAPAAPGATYVAASALGGLALGAHRYSKGDSIEFSAAQGVAAATACLGGPIVQAALAPIAPSLGFGTAALALGVGTAAVQHSEGKSITEAVLHGAAVTTGACVLGPGLTVAAGVVGTVVAATEGRGERLWERAMPHTQTIIKSTASAVAGIAAATLTPAPAVALAAASGLSTAASRYQSGDSVGTSLAIGAAAAFGGYVAGPVAVATAAATVGGGAVAMATNPGETLLVQLPDAELLELETPDNRADPLPEEPARERALLELEGKISQFGTNPIHGLSWTDPHDEMIKLVQERGPNLLKDIRDAVEALGHRPSNGQDALDTAKVTALHRVMAGAGITVPAPAGLSFTLGRMLEQARIDVQNQAQIDSVTFAQVLSQVGIAVQDPAHLNLTVNEVMTQARIDMQDPASLTLPLAQVLTQANIAVLDSTVLNVSLLEKVRALRLDSKLYATAKERTDGELEQLVQNSSVFTTIYFIHVNRLGFEMTNDVNIKFKEIIKQATTKLDNNELPSLWDVYMQHLGHRLSFFKKIWARIWYFFSHTLGIIPSALNSFVTNVISEFRKGVESTNTDRLNSVFSKTLDQLSLFLELYNGAARNYASADTPDGHMRVFQRMAIARMGDDDLFQRVKADLKPGENLGKKMMQALSYELTNSLIDRCFPKIELFASLKKTKLLGIRIGIIFDILDWVFGGIINFIIREITRFYLPGITQSLVELGLNRTLPQEWAFKIALADSVTNLLEQLTVEVEHPQATTPPKLVANTLINGAATKLIEALKLKQLGDNASKEEVAACVATFGAPRTPYERELHKQLIMGAQIFIHFFSTYPEKMETMFGDILKLSNEAFSPEAETKTEQDCEFAYTRLKETTRNLIQIAVRQEVTDQVRGPNPDRLKEYMEGIKDADENVTQAGIFAVQQRQGKQSFQTLSKICTGLSQNVQRGDPEEGIALMKELDHYVKTVKEFTSRAKAIEIERYPKAVQHGFYKRFHSIYKKSSQLVQQAIDLKSPQIKYNKSMRLSQKFNAMTQIFLNRNPHPDDLQRRLREIEEIGRLHNIPIPSLDRRLTLLRQHLSGVEIAAADAETERQLIIKLQDLGSPDYFINNLLVDPKTMNELARHSVPTEDQEALFGHIREFQIAARQEPRPNLAPMRAQIDGDLRRILQRHQDLQAAKIVQMNNSLTQFRNEVVAAEQEYTASRNAEKASIQRQLTQLTTHTDRLLHKLEDETVPVIRLPMLRIVPEPVLNLAFEHFGQPIVDFFEPYVTAALELITHNDVYQGSARLLMGNVINSYPRYSRGIASSIFQCCAGVVLPSPVTNVTPLDV